MCAQNYNIKFDNDYCLINDGNGYLMVDIGAPRSFSESRTICINGRNFNVLKELPPYNVAEINVPLETRVVGLIGMDIFNELGAVIDYRNGLIQFDNVPDEGLDVSDEPIFGEMPTIKMEINGRPVRFAIDTGAPMSYINRQFVQGMTPVGIFNDYNPHPNVRHFTANVYELNSTLAGQEWAGRYGVLPQELENNNVRISIDGVIGKQLFDRFRVILKDGRVLLNNN